MAQATKYGFYGRLQWLLTARPDGFKYIFNMAKDRLPIFIKYAKVELRPPNMSEIGKAKSEAVQVYNYVRDYNNITMREIAINAVVLADFVIFFVIGEVIGRGSWIGYNCDYNRRYRFNLTRIKNVAPYREQLENNAKSLGELPVLSHINMPLK